MKQRLDWLLIEKGLAVDLTGARALIMAGQVSSNGQIIDKPGQTVDSGLEIHLKDQPKYVSRAGIKLESVAGPLGLDFASKVVLDVGSSTGGFTDYVLQHGAHRVYGVDVGTGQLSYKLRQDSRVVLMEQTDIRAAVLPELVDVAVIDVSFISILRILSSVLPLVKSGAPIIAMIKPQFEASKVIADKYRGVIPVGHEREQILQQVREGLIDMFEILAEHDSGLSGAEGNLERFMVLRGK